MSISAAEGDHELYVIRDAEFPTATVADIPKRKAARGRAAFAEDICTLHGGTLDTPCRKFSQLPGNGRGPATPNVIRRSRVFILSLVKPMILFGVVGLTLFGLLAILPRMVSFDFVPTAPTTTVTNENRVVKPSPSVKTSNGRK